MVPSGEQQGTWVRLVRRGTVLALGIVEFVKVVDRPNAPFWSNVDNRPAPMRSYTMLAPAQSALLKVLEEPPPATVFILVTSRPDMLLPTVHSRCPRLRFQSAEREQIDEDVRDAARDVLVEVAATDDPGRRLDAAKDLLPKGGSGKVERDHVAAHLRAMASLLRDVEVLATRADVRVLANSDVRPDLDRLMKSFGGDRGVRAFTAVDQALTALDENANAKIVADWLVLQL